MKYEDMTFTEEDKKRLEENRDQIIEWIETNIVPNIAKDDRIIVEFGGTYRDPRSFGDPVANYRLAVYGKEETIYSAGSGSTTKGNIGYGQRYGGISKAFKAVWSAWDLYPVIDNWKLIKDKLLNEMYERKKNKKAIYSFEV